METVSEWALIRRPAMVASRAQKVPTPSQQGDGAGAGLIHPAGDEVLPGRTVVASSSMRRQRIPQAVQAANLFSGQLLGGVDPKNETSS